MHFDKLLNTCKRSKKKLLLLDYDGTLVELQADSRQSEPSDHLSAILGRLSERNNTKVIIVTGRSSDDIEAFLGHLNIDIVAEHGAMTKANGHWSDNVSSNCEWKDEAIALMQGICSDCPGSFIETKNFCISWHYRKSEAKKGQDNSLRLKDKLKELAASYDLRIMEGNKVLELISKKNDKGKAVSNIIENTDYDCIVSMGDDVTDEDMFRALSSNENAYTVKVGKGDTSAKYRVQGVSEVIELLDRL